MKMLGKGLWPEVDGRRRGCWVLILGLCQGRPDEVHVVAPQEGSVRSAVGQETALVSLTGPLGSQVTRSPALSCPLIGVHELD